VSVQTAKLEFPFSVAFTFYDAACFTLSLPAAVTCDCT